MPASAPVLWEPETGWAPLQLPDAVQVVAFVALQSRTEDAPALIVAGVTSRVTIGAGGPVTDTVTVSAAVPPGPVQVRV